VNHWSTQQLAELFAAVGQAADERTAVAIAAERATEALEAEVGAVLRHGRVEFAWGVDRDHLDAQLAAAGGADLGEPHVSAGRAATVAVAGLGELHVSAAPVGAAAGGLLLVGRQADDFSPEERHLLRAMAESLGLALHNLALLAAERRLREEREREAAERLALLRSLREARHDSLTALPSRVLFLEMLAGKLRGTRPVSVLFIDLDRFKAVNDSLGHRAGDELLAHVAGRIRGCLRPADVGCRLGGDEFAVLLDDTAAGEAVPVARRLVGSICRPYRVSGRDVVIGASVGIATGTAGTDPAELLGHADVAMYRAKEGGSGKVVTCTPGLLAEASARVTLHTDLQRALTAGEFRLHYQPLVRLDSGATTGVEALVRWQRPDGMVLPGDFLPAAEENGLIGDLGAWVMRTAGHQAARWRRTMPDLTMSVNVSGRQFTDPQFAAEVERMLQECGLPPWALTLDLAESVLMADPDSTVALLTDLKDLGVRVAIDDFGVGLSSLSYLQQLPVAEIKIDRAFLRRAQPAAGDFAVVRALAGLARTLRLRTVVEGIETEDQRRHLRRLGCDLGQGHHLRRPARPEELFTPVAA
jgi:diguanylate cyclase (GGDEF)-like protein